MKYENQPCPACGKPLLPGDDVVVCPDCGTPQHRACWMAAGRCANDARHGADFLWTPDAGIPTPEPDRASGTVYICPICGSENPPDALHCGNCGALRGETGARRCPYCDQENDADATRCTSCGAALTPGAAFPFFAGNPFLRATPYEESEIIGGRTANDLSLYVQQSARRYLPKFKRFAEGRKLSFNFGAFFFAPYWFFYRKLYKAGAFFLLLFAVLPLLLINCTQQLNEIVTPYYEVVQSGEALSDEAAMEILTKMTTEMRTPLLVILGSRLALHLVCGLAADPLYYRKLQRDFAVLDEQPVDPPARKMLLMRRGGTSALSFLAAFFGLEALTQGFYYIADFIASRIS